LPNFNNVTSEKPLDGAKKPGIDKIAPSKSCNAVQLNPDEVIEVLWNAFWGNYSAFTSGEMRLEDEASYFLYSVPGPSQYNAFDQFFSFLENPKEQLWSLKERMYTHDLAMMDEKSRPGIVELFENIIKFYTFNGEQVILVSGSFWKNHIPTRRKVGSLFEELHEKGARPRMVTRAKWDEPYVGDVVSLLGKNSRFGMYERIPLHFVRVGDDFLYFEFPHTESSMYRLNMLLDLDTLKYKQGKAKADLLKFLDQIIKKAV
jgi:hypothetical protein